MTANTGRIATFNSERIKPLKASRDSLWDIILSMLDFNEMGGGGGQKPIKEKFIFEQRRHLI